MSNSSSVFARKNQDGSFITVSKNNSEYGHIVLESTESVISAGWLRESKRNALLRAPVALLEKFLTSFNPAKLPGRIVVKEYVESELPANFHSEIVGKSGDAERFIKRAGKDGPALTCNGEVIYRWSEYDATGQAVDIMVQHDNSDEVKASKENVQSAKL